MEYFLYFINIFTVRWFTYFLFAVGEALQFPGGLDPLHLDLEGVGGEALPVLVNLHLPTKVLYRPREAEVGVVPEVKLIVAELMKDY